VPNFSVSAEQKHNELQQAGFFFSEQASSQNFHAVCTEKLGVLLCRKISRTD